MLKWLVYISAAVVLFYLALPLIFLGGSLPKLLKGQNEGVKWLTVVLVLIAMVILFRMMMYFIDQLPT